MGPRSGLCGGLTTNLARLGALPRVRTRREGWLRRGRWAVGHG